MIDIFAGRLLQGNDGVEDVVPDLARHAEPEVEVLVVVGKMVLLHLLQMRRKAGVMHAVEGD